MSLWQNRINETQGKETDNGRHNPNYLRRRYYSCNLCYSGDCGMMKQPNPYNFANYAQFERAYSEWKVRDMRRPTTFDNYATCDWLWGEIREARAIAKQEARVIYEFSDKIRKARG